MGNFIITVFFILRQRSYTTLYFICNRLFSDTNHKVVWQDVQGLVGFLITTLLQIYNGIFLWKYFKNGLDLTESYREFVASLFPHPVCYSRKNPPWRRPRCFVESPRQPSEMVLGFQPCLLWFPDYKHFGFKGLHVANGGEDDRLFHVWKVRYQSGHQA